MFDFLKFKSKQGCLILLLILIAPDFFAQSFALNPFEAKQIPIVQVIFSEYAGHPEKIVAASKDLIAKDSSKENYGAEESMKESLRTALSPTGGGLFNFHSKEDAKGSAYLLSDWVHGIVFRNTGEPVYDAGIYFNYNKQTGDLIVTNDLKSGLTIDKYLIAGFVLLFPDNLVHIYTLIPSINQNLYCEVLDMNKAGAMLKLTTTQFEKANYQTDGMTSYGKNYDEYVDDNSYYFLNLSDNSVIKFSLKKKDIKQAFGTIPKANDFLSKHNGEELNENFLKELCDAID